MDSRTNLFGIWSDVYGNRESQGDGYLRAGLVNAAGNEITVQNPLPTDGDSTYCKDLKLDDCITTNWISIEDDENDICCIPFNDLHTRIRNSSADNPKILRIHFNRTIAAHQIGLGAFSEGDFSNLKINLLGSGGVVRSVVDESTSDTKYTSRNYPFEPELFNAVQLEFYTADPVTLSNITIQKSVNVSAQIQGLRADGTIGTVNLTNGNNLKVSIEEFETDVSTNGNTQLKTTVYDEAGNPLEIDDTTGSIQSVEYEHHEIHSGSHYNLCDYVLGQGLNDTIEFVVTTPNTTKWGHLTFSVFSSTGAIIDTFEGTTGVVGGTTLTPRNNNRNSVNTSAMTVIQDPASIVDDGNDAGGYLAGANRSAGFVSRDNEVILKQNTTYLFRITSLAASNNISWCFEWYEHTNKV